MERTDPKFRPGDKVRFIGIQPGEEPYFPDVMKRFVQDHPILTIKGYFDFNMIYRQNQYDVQELKSYGWLEDWFVPAELPRSIPPSSCPSCTARGGERHDLPRWRPCPLPMARRRHDRRHR